VYNGLEVQAEFTEVKEVRKGKYTLIVANGKPDEENIL
jgi:hypothetical protein